MNIVFVYIKAFLASHLIFDILFSRVAFEINTKERAYLQDCLVDLPLGTVRYIIYYSYKVNDVLVQV